QLSALPQERDDLLEVLAVDGLQLREDLLARERLRDGVHLPLLLAELLRSEGVLAPGIAQQVSETIDRLERHSVCLALLGFAVRTRHSARFVPAGGTRRHHRGAGECAQSASRRCNIRERAPP